MKKHIAALLCAITLSAAANRSGAQTIIDYWNFNSFTGVNYTPYIPPVDADYSVLDTSKARIYYTELAGTSDSFSTYEDFYATIPADSDNVNLQFGDTAGNALRLRNPSDSMYLLLYIPTTHFRNISIAYGAEASSATHGMLQQFFSYSLDSGATWITSGGLSMQYDTVMTIFSLTSVSFTDTNANNNPRLVFRIAFGPNNTGTSGNDRIDNVTVKGDSIGGTISAVKQVAAPITSYNIYPNPVEHTLYIDATTDGNKMIVVYNDLGQSVYQSTQAGRQIAINADGLAPGIYIVNITESATGIMKSVKFVK